jgi:hypothetical protein
VVGHRSRVEENVAAGPGLGGEHVEQLGIVDAAVGFAGGVGVEELAQMEHRDDVEVREKRGLVR